MEHFLIEYFNTTNQTISVALAHEKLVVYIEENNCNMVQKLKYKYRCKHVMTHSDCDENVNYVHYVRMLYCTLNPQTNVAHISSVILLLFAMACMFVILAETADKFFCPALTALAKWLKMNESLAGLTLLAFGNGAPDVFTSIAADPTDVGLVLSEGFGAGCLVAGLTVGIIVLIRPCQVFGPNFLRDILFFILGIFLIDLFVRDGYITYFECFGIISIYIIFIIVVTIDQILMSRSSRAEQIEQKSQESIGTITILSFAGEVSEIQIIARKRPTIAAHVIDIHDTFQTRFSNDHNKNIIKQFLTTLNPINIEDWNASNTAQKFFTALEAPVIVILTLIIPIVDLEKEGHGWSKLLNTLQVITIPQVVIAMSSKYGNPNSLLTPLSLYCFLVSVPLAITVFFTSRTSRPPIYHFVFCLLSVGMSIFFISCVANEVVNILFTIGMASLRSKSFLATTLLAAGNSVSDMLANPALARQGYTKMALAACYGGPMFNILTGQFVIFFKVLQKSGDPGKISQGLLGPNTMIFLQLILIMTVFALLCTNFHLRRSTGIYIIILYCLHILYACLGEFEIIHPFGASHET